MARCVPGAWIAPGLRHWALWPPLAPLFVHMLWWRGAPARPPQVKAHMAAPETLSAAVARVRRLVSGSPAEGEEEEEDEELLVSHQVVSLKDPMSGQRMQVGAAGGWAAGVGAAREQRHERF